MEDFFQSAAASLYKRAGLDKIFTDFLRKSAENDSTASGFCCRAESLRRRYWY
jgi:hypothetical protein